MYVLVTNTVTYAVGRHSSLLYAFVSLTTQLKNGCAGVNCRALAWEVVSLNPDH